MKKAKKIEANTVALVQSTKNDLWFFTGFGVPSALAVCNKDGSPAEEDRIRIAREHGPRLAGLKVRTWDDEEEAIADAEAAGLPREAIQVSPNRL